MEHDFVFVEYVSNINTAINNTFQSMQRVKVSFTFPLFAFTN